MADQSLAPRPPRPNTLAELLDRPATDRPDQIALVDGTTSLTWDDYRRRADALAARLIAAGLGPGDRVGVVMPKSVHSFVAAHAVVRAGAVIVPIDWLAPPELRAQVLATAGAVAVLTTLLGDPLTDLRDSTAIEIVVDPTDDDLLSSTGDGSTDGPAARVRADDVAYIIFTSGSTGVPKGIVHTHASGLAYADAAVRTYGIRADDRLTNIAPLHFDQSTFELYAAPLAGAATIVVPDVVTRFPADLAALVADQRATVWYSVPFALSQLVERGAIDRHDMSSLRWILYGGEPFQPAAMRRAMTAFPGARFSNVYGPAEVNQCTFHHLIEPPTGDEPVPIGRPWSIADVLVVDEEGRAVIGAGTGELWVASATMMAGYWDAPELTARSIVERDGRRWYRTGDIVRRRRDGELTFVGRADHQVKLRGHRIELEAVDAAIADHPAVGAGVAVVDRRSDDRLVALVSPPLDPEVERDVLRSLRLRLPRYAVPACIVGIVTLPRTRTGKIDRQAATRLLETSSSPRSASPA